MQKARYAVDSHNRLVVKRGKKRLNPAGRFSVKDNILYYWLNEPQAWLRKNSLPQKLKFAGAWKLNKNRDLVLDLSQGRNARRKETLALHGRILPAQGDVLAFELAADCPGNKKEYRILHLTGAWKASEDNGLFFEAKKRVLSDILSLGTGWKLDKRQQVVYTYTKTDLVRRSKSEQTIEFRGSWQLLRKDYLTYILERGTASRFDFRVQAESPNLYPQKGVIKFRLGAGVKQQAKAEPKTLSLYGTWKFGVSPALTFEMDYGEKKVKALTFSADIDLSEKDTIVFTLVDSRRRPLGLQLQFNRKFLKKHDAEAFLRLKKLCDESVIEAGVSIPF